MQLINIAFAADNDLTKAVDSVLPGGIANIFNFGLAVGALLAFGTIIYAGILYSSSGDNPSKQKEARAWIMAAVQGLALIGLGYLILRTINPNFTSLNIVPPETIDSKLLNDGSGGTGGGTR